MIERLLLWIASHFKMVRIEGACGDTLGPYLDRYYVIGGHDHTPWFGFAVYIHHIWRSDVERDLHDHPWNFLSLILTRGYIEVTDNGQAFYPRGSILWRPAQWRHRLILDGPVWTVIVRSRKKKSWGFYTKDGYVHWKAYEYNEGCE